MSDVVVVLVEEEAVDKRRDAGRRRDVSCVARLSQSALSQVRMRVLTSTSDSLVDLGDRGMGLEYSVAQVS
jgi:IS5 family transposase